MAVPDMPEQVAMLPDANRTVRALELGALPTLVLLVPIERVAATVDFAAAGALALPSTTAASGQLCN